MISDFLVAMPVRDRTKKNCRDVLKAFFGWAKMRGYLPKDSDLMEGVQSYSNRKIGSISIFTPEELLKLIEAARPEMLPYVVLQACLEVFSKRREIVNFFQARSVPNCTAK
jgi:hypothetical protein